MEVRWKRNTLFLDYPGIFDLKCGNVSILLNLF
jgi:hypothetical protein